MAVNSERVDLDVRMGTAETHQTVHVATGGLITDESGLIQALTVLDREPEEGWSLGESVVRSAVGVGLQEAGPVEVTDER